MRRAIPSGITALAAMLALAGGAHGAARVEYRGQALSPRQIEGLAQPALRAPGDSVAVARTLGAVVDQLQELGHLDARVAARWEGSETLVIEPHEGPRYRLRSMVISAGAGVDSARFAAGLTLKAGDAAGPRAVTAAIQHALENVVGHGYPYAELGVSGWQADSGSVALTLAGALGPQVTVTRARVEGLRITRRSVVERSMGRLAGLPYQEESALAARDRLAQLGLFRSVSFEGLEGEGDWSKAQLVYKVEEQRYNRVEGAFGMQGKTGTVGMGQLDLGNLLGTGRALSLAWQSRGAGRTDFGARYAEPLVLGTPLRVEAAVDQQVRDTLYTRTRWGGRMQFMRAAGQKFEAGYDQERVVQSTGDVEEATFQNTLFSVERSTLDSPLAPRRGSRVTLQAAQIVRKERLRPFGDRTSNASALEGHGEWTRAVRARSAIALELGAAGRFGSQKILPDYERYMIGGAATLRGYDEEQFHADRFALSRLEWRWFMARAQRAFLFWDHAWMGTRVAVESGGDRFDTLHRDGVGFGMRLETAGGVVGIDYGLEPGRPPLEGKIHLRLVSTF